MLFLMYLVVQVLARFIGARGQDEGSKDLEILVLRHQLRVLRSKTGPPKGRAADRVLLAVASRSSHGTAGQASWSPRRRSFAGIASS